MSTPERPPLPCAGPRGSRISTWLVVTLIGVSTALIVRQLFWYSPLFNPNAEPRAVTPRGDLAADEQSTIALFETVAPSVVHVTSLAVQQNVFTRDVRTIPAGTGSGFVWDQDGHIVTNLHVIRDAQGASVVLSDNSQYSARLVGFDESNDLAVLKIDAPPNKLTPIAVGESRSLKVGQKVFAIGCPFEFDQTLTTGVISGLNRTVETQDTRIIGAIQTDAAINPGNSGGPLLDSAGRLIGVNTAIASESGGSHGVGFAIPVDLVNLTVPDLIRNGRISRPWLGLTVWENVVVDRHRLQGVVVERVVENGPAHRAGILPVRRDENHAALLGDQIIAIDGHSVDSYRDLIDLLSRYREGDTVEVTVIRAGEVLHLPVLLEALPEAR